MSKTTRILGLLALPKHIEERCEVTEYGAIRDRVHDRVYDESPDEDEVAIVLPGYCADDGNAEVEYPDADTGREAAEDYVDGGDWGSSHETAWVTVYTWRTAYMLNEDGELARLRLDYDSYTIGIEPDEPDCEDGLDHDWRSPYSVVGGARENPGVWGHGGGVVIEEVCAHCGAYRITDTWAQDPYTGVQGLRSVEYRDPDDASLAWVQERRDAE